MGNEQCAVGDDSSFPSFSCTTRPGGLDTLNTLEFKVFILCSSLQPDSTHSSDQHLLSKPLSEMDQRMEKRKRRTRKSELTRDNIEKLIIRSNISILSDLQVEYLSPSERVQALNIQ
jgi:hypothetical protein